MNFPLPTILILVSILLLLLVALKCMCQKHSFGTNSCPFSRNCWLIEYESDPDDSPEIDHPDDIETFRVSGGRPGGGRPGGGRPGGGRPGGGRPGGGRPGGGRPGGGGRPWRRWPRYHPRRHWRSNTWWYYPEIVTYPDTYYTVTWEQPVTRYLVRLAPKTDRNPFYGGEGSDYGFTINGISGARLDLQRGKTYEFDVFTGGEPFFFTTDSPEGGSEKGKVFDIAPAVNGVIRVTITDETPEKFYYVSTNNKYVGGYVFVH